LEGYEWLELPEIDESLVQSRRDYHEQLQAEGHLLVQSVSKRSEITEYGPDGNRVELLERQALPSKSLLHKQTVPFDGILI